MLIPSIDISKGKAVQLRNGQHLVIEREDIMELAEEFSLYGEVAVIDIDAAKSQGNNREIIKELCSRFACRVGGGIRDLTTAKEILGYGAKKIIIGTAANPEFLKQLDPSRVVVALDTREDLVFSHGWEKNTNVSIYQKIKELEPYCSEFLYTKIEMEGMLQGIDKKGIVKLKELTSNQLTYAGGVTDIEDFLFLERLVINSQIGMSIYSGIFSLPEAFISSLEFDINGLIPTIVQDKNKSILMMAYSSKESLRKAFSIRRGVYYSRSRKKLWIKGETSGNYQLLRSVRFDCDRDTLLFEIEQIGVACHTNRYSCFGVEDEFDLQKLYQILLNRKGTGSFTDTLFQKPEDLEEKLREEIGEVIQYSNRSNLVWELADITYFLLVLMAREKINPSEVLFELRRRQK